MGTRVRRAAPLLAGIVLALAAAVPVVANGSGYIRIDVEVYGYTPGYVSGGMNFDIACSGVPADPIGVEMEGTTGSSELGGPFPVGTTCWVVGADPGWAGEIATFAEPEVWPPSVTIGTEAAVFSVRVSREWTGEQPAWDSDGEMRLDLLTADQALVNRYGGLTISGRMHCGALADLPVDPHISLRWEAIQYAGRRTVITGRYDPAIAQVCVDVSSPDAIMPWRTLGPGTQDTVQWIYGTGGKFAAGAVHLEVRVEAEPQIVSQWWDPADEMYDPACSPEPTDSGYYDANGDGFCALRVLVWGAEQFDLRAARAR